MGEFTLGGLVSVDLAGRLDLVAKTTATALDRSGMGAQVGVVEIDPDDSETASTQARFGLDPATLANCVIVAGKRDGVERIAACVVLASTRADINTVVRKLLDVRKASFLPMEAAVALSSMEFGGITPIGLPAEWPIYVDRRVVNTDVIIIGSGIRRSKLMLRGELLAELPGVRVIDDLAR